MNHVADQLLLSRENLLREQYGEILTLKEIAVIFRFPSLQACRKAIARGQLPIPLIQFPNRKGRFATARAIASYLNQIDSGANVDNAGDLDQPQEGDK